MTVTVRSRFRLPALLLVLGALMVIAGIQLVSFGLLAEMIVCGSNREIDPPVDMVLKQAIGAGAQGNA